MKRFALLATASALGAVLMTQAFAADTSSRSSSSSQDPTSGPSSFESHTTPGAGPEPIQPYRGTSPGSRSSSDTSSSASESRDPTSGPSSFGPESHTTPGAGPEPR